MGGNFQSFIILAGMRTGSNFLEDSLNQYPGITSLGEVFNPHFIGGPKKKDLFGVTLSAREADPEALLQRIRDKTEGLCGFRFFYDHDPRIFQHCMKDRTCAKIVLRRNPVESYVSREIARETDQWRLRDMKNAKSAQITFDQSRFQTHLDENTKFYGAIQSLLQTSGQAAFFLNYEDIPDPDVMNGLARFLGQSGDKKQVAAGTKKQNPAPLRDKVRNYSDMVTALSGLDVFSLDQDPSFEPARSPGVPNFVATVAAPLIFMPVPAGPSDDVLTWLSGISADGEDGLITKFTQKTLRQWKRQNKGHRSFTVVSHPVARLHRAFVQHIVLPGPANYAKIRQALVSRYGFPEQIDGAASIADKNLHRQAFLKFAEFVGGNLAGQTSIRVDGAWASQTAVLAGMGKFMQPDHVMRECDLVPELGYLADLLGLKAPAPRSTPSGLLAGIYDQQVEKAVRTAYQRDYMMFGFGKWRD